MGALLAVGRSLPRVSGFVYVASENLTGIIARISHHDRKNCLHCQLPHKMKFPTLYPKPCQHDNPLPKTAPSSVLSSIDNSFAAFDLLPIQLCQFGALGYWGIPIYETVLLAVGLGLFLALPPIGKNIRNHYYDRIKHTKKTGHPKSQRTNIYFPPC